MVKESINKRTGYLNWVEATLAKGSKGLWGKYIPADADGGRKVPFFHNDGTRMKKEQLTKAEMDAVKSYAMGNTAGGGGGGGGNEVEDTNTNTSNSDSNDSANSTNNTNNTSRLIGATGGWGALGLRPTKN